MAAPSAPKAGTTNARPKAKDGAGGKKEAKVVYPSEFGSHTSMANEELTGKIAAGSQDAADAWVILVDERGVSVAFDQQVAVQGAVRNDAFPGESCNKSILGSQLA